MAERPIKIRSRTPADAAWVRERFIEEWHGEFLVLEGRRVYADEIAALVAHDGRGTRLGMLGFRPRGDAVEIVTLLAVERGQGVGTLLVEEIARYARAQGAARLIVSTTNDNLDALRFYQRRGFALARLHPGVMASVRAEKPGLPETGEYDIPLRDVLELERAL
ncbi:MAG: GNAT family N-acetyltransferase [Anaerosomatales bacterium]|nr:GNAT family N-acetyltransferase [Anaerosomatales bacterium]